MDAVNKILSREVAATTAIAMQENTDERDSSQSQSEFDSKKNRTHCG